MVLHQVRMDGEVLDLVLWRAYGRAGEPLVEETLRTNPGLAEQGPIMPLGMTIGLPDKPVVQPYRQTAISLFD